mmetsp:Transcript_10166/g.17710  ORF Transcript_10166/g.17710 Transcript_10166/m.17710 type:complete len:237 (-) Transcript_10166:137-847(-)
MASTTKSVSVGRTAALMARNSAIMSSSTCNLPAVSTMMASTLSRLPSASPALAISTGFALVPISKTGTLMDAPSFCSCSMAAGRYTSVATMSTLFFCFMRYSANFPQAVVFPTPCRPAIRMTCGKPCSKSLLPLLPINSVNSSLTVLMNWTSGVTPGMTSRPSAFSSSFFTKRRTTGKLTSASNRARRISFRGSLMFSAVSLSLPVRSLVALSMPRLSLSNMAARMTRLPRLTCLC